MKRILIILLLCMAAYYNCGLFGDFEEPEVATYSPGKNSKNIDINHSVEMLFSEPMECPLTEKAFTLTLSGNKVNGYYRWKDGDKKMIFSPEYPLKRGQIYYAAITKEAEDKNGNNLLEELSWKFVTGGETIQPYIVSTYPDYGAIGISKDANIQITFSEAVDNKTLINGISFAPSFEYQLTMNNQNRTAVFNPINSLQYGTTYKVQINNQVEDLEGNNLLDDYTFIFTIGNDFTAPALISARNSSSAGNWNPVIVNNNVEKDDSIIFIFTKPIQHNNIENYITFSPSVDGSFFWDNDYQVHFTPTDAFDIQATYGLNISKSLSDTNGNQLSQNYAFNFRINGPNSTPPEVINISSTNINDQINHWINNQWVSIHIDDTYTNIRIYFSNPMDPIKVINNLDVEYIGGSGSGSVGVEITKFKWNGPADTMLQLNLGDLDSGNIYRIKISGGKDGAADKNNNYLIEDFIIFFKT